MTIEFYDASTFSMRRFVSKSFVAESNMRLCIESSPFDLNERHARIYVGASASNMCDRIYLEGFKIICGAFAARWESEERISVQKWLQCIVASLARIGNFSIFIREYFKYFVMHLSHISFFSQDFLVLDSYFREDVYF